MYLGTSWLIIAVCLLQNVSLNSMPVFAWIQNDKIRIGVQSLRSLPMPIKPIVASNSSNLTSRAALSDLHATVSTYSAQKKFQNGQNFQNSQNLNFANQQTSSSTLAAVTSNNSRNDSKGSTPENSLYLGSEISGILNNSSAIMDPLDGGISYKNMRANLSTRQAHVSPKVAQMLYEDMLLGRFLEDACFQLYYKGKTAGFVHLYTGQEAVSTGVIKLLRKDDAVASTYRDHVHALSKGVSARQVMAELFGKATGCSKGHGGSMHMFSKEHNFIGGFAFIGEQIPVAVGYGFSQAYRKFTGNVVKPENDQVTVCFMGDGTTNIGQFYESLNMASLMKLPVIFVVENNNWAIGMAALRSTSMQEIYRRGPAFGIPSIQVDGMNVLAVRAAAREAIDRARRGEGPTLIEALTYRFRGHSVADPDTLRCTNERAAFSSRDPISAFERYMLLMGYGNQETFQQTREKIKAIADDAVEFAETSPDPDVSTCADAVFAPGYQAGKPEELSSEQLHAYALALKEELDFQERKKAGIRDPPPPVQDSINPPIVID